MSTAEAAVPTLITLRWVPDFARGLVRDLRVRWALEEAGMAYRLELVDFEEKNLPPYRALQPFGQVPAYRDGDKNQDNDSVSLFESGAIVHRIASHSPALMPSDEAGRSHTLAWMFAAVNSVEPAVTALADIDLFNADAEWARLRRPAALKNVDTKLADLDTVLAQRDYLVERFTCADIMMATVLNILRHTDLVATHPKLHAYHQRCMTRPAAKKAMADQMDLYADTH